MKWYYVFFPRCFANEYTVYSAQTKFGRLKAKHMEWLHSDSANSDFHRISRATAISFAGKGGDISLDDSSVSHEDALDKRKRYYVFYPRNFANEYTVFSARTPDGRKKAEEMMERYASEVNADFHRINREVAFIMAGPDGDISLDGDDEYGWL